MTIIIVWYCLSALLTIAPLMEPILMAKKMVRTKWLFETHLSGKKREQIPQATAKTRCFELITDPSRSYSTISEQLSLHPSCIPMLSRIFQRWPLKQYPLPDACRSSRSRSSSCRFCAARKSCVALSGALKACITTRSVGGLGNG